MDRMTIIEAIKKVLHDNGAPMTSQEIFNGIVAKNLYNFHAQDPYGVVKTQIRRHCVGMDFPTAYATKHFTLVEGNKFYYFEQPIKKRRTRNGRVKEAELACLEESQPESFLQKLKELQATHTEVVKKRILGDLKKINPANFETFAKRLLEAYGFQDMKVTDLHKDGGIDGHGRLRVGLAYMNVAFQCKRWTKGNVGRTEIDKFRGAIQGKYAQGIFFTTAGFVPGVETESFRPGAVPIILIGGGQIVDMMIDKEFGLAIETLPIYSYALDLVLSDENDK